MKIIEEQHRAAREYYEAELAARDAQIRELQEQSREAASADSTFARDLARLNVDLSALIAALGFIKRDEAEIRFTSVRETKTIAQDEQRTTKAWSGVIAAVVAGILTGVSAFAQSHCSDAHVEVPNTAPRPASSGPMGVPQ